MKKIIALLFCVTLALSCLVNVTAEQPQNDILANDAPMSIDSFVQYINQNVTEVVNPDGSVTVTLNPNRDVAAPIPNDSTQNIATETTTVNYNTSSEPVFLSNMPDYNYTTGQTHTPISFEEKYLYSLLIILLHHVILLFN